MKSYFFRLQLSLILVTLFSINQSFGQQTADTTRTANDSLKNFLNKQVKSVVIAPLASQGIEFSFGVFPLGDSIIVAQHKGKKHGAWDAEASEYVQINNKEPQTDLYVSSADGVKSRLFSTATATPRNDGSACLSPDGKELYFTQSYKVQKQLHFSIQVAVLEKNNWVIKPERAIESKTIHYAYPSLSPDGKLLYIASTKNGSWDIFVMKRVGSQWGEPQALSYANSSDDEMFPSMLNDSILMLSADRSDSYGGLDIYYVNTRTKSKPVNMKLPINTEYDDVSIAFRAKNDSTGYLVSNRNPSLPKDQLYSFNIHWKQIDTTKRKRVEYCDSLLVPVSVSFMIDQSLKPEAEKKLSEFSTYIKGAYKVTTNVSFTPGSKISPDVDPNQNMVDVNLTIPSRGAADARQRLAAIMESLLHEENKLAQQRKETDKASNLYEQVSKNASSAATQNMQAKTVAATPVAPKDGDLEDVNLFFKSYQNNDDIQAIIEVIDPGAEQLGRPQRVESRKKVALKKGNDYAVNVSVEKDDDMYIAGNKQQGKSSTIEVSKDQKKSVYTENKEYEDVYNKLYTVQVNALTAQVPASYFGKLRNIKMYACMDGLYRYTYGRAANPQDAERILNTVREAGFTDAFIISLRRIEKKLQDVYAIQVEASFSRRNADYFKNLSDVMEYVGCADEMYRYAVGRYSNMTEAMTELSRIKSLGYTTAFITNVKRFDFKRSVE